MLPEMLNRTMFVSLLLVLSCSSAPGWTPLNGAALRASTPKTIAVRVGRPSFFRTPSGSSAIFAVVNNATMKNALSDPSKIVGHRLAIALAQKFSMEVEQPGSTDLTLAITTADWAFVCNGECHAIYRASLRLTDNRRGNVLATGDCESQATEAAIASKGAFSHTVYIAALQRALATAGEDCVEIYRTKLFNIFDRPSPEPSERGAVGPGIQQSRGG
jgi:hypothetical protein